MKQEIGLDSRTKPVDIHFTPTTPQTLEQCSEQFQKVQIKGCAELTTLSAATATSSSVHQDVITIHNTQCM